MRKLLLLPTLVSPLLAGCGGGGADDDTPPPDGYVRIEGTVLDASGAAVADAQARLPSTLGTWTAATDASGRFRLEARASDFANVNPVMLQVVRDGYRPLPVYFAGLNAGVTYQVPAGGAQTLQKLSASEYIPKNSLGLWHVGNDYYGGEANSQLQTKTAGTGLVFTVTPWTPELKAAHKSATVEFVARGVQTIKCPGTQFGLAAGDFLSVPPLGDSDPTGGFSKYRFSIDVQGVAAGRELLFFVRSGSCIGTSAGDIDDFEFSNVVVTFGP